MEKRNTEQALSASNMHPAWVCGVCDAYKLKSEKWKLKGKVRFAREVYKGDYGDRGDNGAFPRNPYNTRIPRNPRK